MLYIVRMGPGDKVSDRNPFTVCRVVERKPERVSDDDFIQAAWDQALSEGLPNLLIETASGTAWSESLDIRLKNSRLLFGIARGSSEEHGVVDITSDYRCRGGCAAASAAASAAAQVGECECDPAELAESPAVSVIVRGDGAPGRRV